MLYNLLLASTPDPMTWVLLGVLVVVFIGLFFFTNISNKKRQQKVVDMISSLKPGNKIRTIGGIIGTIVEVVDEENAFIIETGSEGYKTTMKIDKAAVYASDAVMPTTTKNNKQKDETNELEKFSDENVNNDASTNEQDKTDDNDMKL